MPSPVRKVKESFVESYLTGVVEGNGGIVRKLKWVSRRGAPDRFIVLFGQIWLVETKKPGAALRPGQEREMVRLRDAGVNTAVLDTVLAVDAWMRNRRASIQGVSLGRTTDGRLCVMRDKPQTKETEE